LGRSLLTGRPSLTVPPLLLARADDVIEPKHPPGPPMTLGNLRQLGVRGLIVGCLNPQCRQEATMSVDDYADEIEVPSFAARMVCRSAAPSAWMCARTGRKCHRLTGMNYARWRAALSGKRKAQHDCCQSEKRR
jgi:hypothetical protein